MIYADGQLVDAGRYALSVFLDGDPRPDGEYEVSLIDRETQEIRAQTVPLRDGWQRRADRRLARLDEASFANATPRSLTR